MCGIYGVLDLEGSPREATARAATDVMRRRGPDDSGFWTDGRVMLGHRRLSILDLSAAGRNPMAGPSGETHIVYNGEVYNYRESRAQLEQRGDHFRSETDTEVLLHLYEHHGLDFLQKLRGMFAFGLWDARRQRLVLARDRFGQKPLYYHRTSRRLVFASEIRALTIHPGVPKQISPTNLDTYFSLGYVPAPRTVFREIRKLPAGHRLVVRPKEDRIRYVGPESYFRLEAQPDFSRSREATVAEARRRLEEAIRLRFVADVPVGAFLSGGVDSSAIVGIMSHTFDQPVKTFSIGFDDERYDELRFARLIAEKFGTEHHEIVLTPEMALDGIETSVRALGEPFADASALNNYFVSRLASRHVKVALAGDGGDEAFAGYERYTREAERNPMAAAPAPIRAAGGWLARRLPEAVSSRFGQVRRIQHALDRSTRDDLGRYLARLFVFSREERRSLYASSFYDRVRDHDALEEYPAVPPPQALDDEILLYQWADLHSYIPEDLMLKADRMSMWHSLEVRTPFLDHELLRFALTIPSEMNILGSDQRKSILKEAMADVIPDEVMYREKRGFALPYGDWMRNRWRPRIEEVFKDPEAWIYGWVKPTYARRLLDRQAAGDFGADWRVWSLFSLELWAREVLA